ncbi:MAG: GAF domain-containing protein [Anaerolineales bacterium]|nr:GAF domain-containing protein [Anaerolineales bacterium]
MSTTQQPLDNNQRSLADSVKRLGQKLMAPHPSIHELGYIRRVQLLNVITLVLIAAFTLGLLARPESVFIFEYMLVISLSSYILGKTKFPNTGTFIFSFGFLTTPFLALLLGIAPEFSTTIYTIVPIALIVASALSSLRTFGFLAIYSTIAAVLAPLYSKTPASISDMSQIGGIIFFTGVILYGILVFRANLENLRLLEIRTTNSELQEIKTNLEKRVEERTRELSDANQQIESRALRLQTISELSRDISAAIDKRPKELLTLIADSISEKLGFYHVGIFLLDENREYAHLRAANTSSLGGQKMLERRHQLKLGGTGIVGYVSQSGRPRIALDTGSDAVFFNNPNLPETKSEMALPLKYGVNVIGVLDMQSTLSSAFSEDDANLLSTLANQIAILIDNVLTGHRSEFSLPNQKTNTPSTRIIRNLKQRDTHIFQMERFRIRRLQIVQFLKKPSPPAKPPFLPILQQAILPLCQFQLSFENRSSVSFISKQQMKKEDGQRMRSWWFNPSQIGRHWPWKMRAFLKKRSAVQIRKKPLRISRLRSALPQISSTSCKSLSKNLDRH